MPIKFFSTVNMQEANVVLAGGLIGTALIERNPEAPAADTTARVAGVTNLQGKKIRFLAPTAITVTFSKAGGNSNTFFSLNDIATQLRAGVSGLAVEVIDGRLALKAAVAVSIDGSSLTTDEQQGHTLLGFPVVAAGVLYGRPDAPSTPRWLNVQVGTSGELIHTVEE